MKVVDRSMARVGRCTGTARRLKHDAQGSFSALALLLSIVGCQNVSTTSQTEPFPGGGTCLYSGHLVDRLEAFGDKIGRSIECAVVFNNAAPTWADLEMPWFVVHGDPNRNWAEWKRAQPERRLIISQALVPDGVPEDWRERGAGGEYDEHARALAINLVAVGLGDSVIRLSHEANGLWTKDGLGVDPARYDAWRETWRRFATAMDSVPGAVFEFDWTVNAGVRPVPFEAYYPGDDVVDYVGVDIYDYWEDERHGPVPADPQERWDTQFHEPAGVAELFAFADAHDKPITIPEWGLSAPWIKGGAGDNPMFVENVAKMVRDHDVVYQSYFEKSEDLLLVDAPLSLEAYRRAFAAASATSPAARMSCRFDGTASAEASGCRIGQRAAAGVPTPLSAPQSIARSTQEDPGDEP